MFKITNIDLGIVRVGGTITLEFPYENISRITDMESSCGCGIPSNIATKNKVTVDYTPKPVPGHLKRKGQYSTTKMIKVNYITPHGERGYQELTFSAIIKD
jgi:hypothetical protein